MKQQSRWKVYLIAVLNIMLWASGNTVIALLQQGDAMTDGEQVFYMSVFAVIVLFAVCLITGRFRGLREIKAAELFHIAALGVLGFYVYYHLLYYGMRHLKVQQASTINYMWPMLIVLFSAVLYRERLSARKVIALLISFLGVAVIATEGDLTNLGGISAAGIAGSGGGACVYALFSVLNLRVRIDKLLAMFLYALFSLAAASVEILMTGSLRVPDAAETAGLFYMGGILAGLVCVVWLWALEAGDTAVISNLAYLNPVFSLFFIWLILKEPIEAYSWCGLALVMTGIAVQVLPAVEGKKCLN